MSEIIPFDFEEQAVRVIMRDDEPWFVAADVCRVLEIGNSRDAVARLDDDERTLVNLNTVGSTDTIRGNPNATVISESGLYALVLTSRKEAARRFRKWITAEVLPAIRRTGRYEHPGLPASEPEADHLSPRDWLALVREARLLGGTAAGRRMWAMSTLPPLNPAAGVLATDPAIGRACAAWLVANAPARLIPALVGNAMADAELAPLGLRLIAAGLFIANTAPIFAGSRWAAGAHRPALRSLSGVDADATPRTLAGVATRGLVLPFAHLGTDGTEMGNG